jgi:hypothetical protein
VTSDPTDADVFLDGSRVGKTPYENKQQPSGSYELRVSRYRYLTTTKTVSISDGSPTVERVALGQNFGSFYVSTTPAGAAIEMNGRATGFTTPHEFEELEPGTYSLKLTLDGHGDAAERVAVRNRERTDVDVPLSAKLGMLTIIASLGGGAPCVGNVIVDGQLRGTTPYKEQLVATRHDVRVTCQGTERRETVALEHNKKTALEWTFGGSQADIRCAEPGNLILVDGEPVGSDAVKTWLNEGTHTVSCEVSGFRSAEQTVRATTGVPIDVTLTPHKEVSVAPYRSDTNTRRAQPTYDEPTTRTFGGASHSLGIDTGVRIPFGNWADATGIVGIGGLFRYEYLGISPQFNVTTRIGFIYGLSKDNGGAKSSTNELPVLAGVKYYFTGYTSGKRQGLNIAGELGLVYITAKAEFMGTSYKSSEAKFGFMAGAGYEVANFDLGARFFAPSVSDIGEFKGVVVTLGYSFYRF